MNYIERIRMLREDNDKTQTKIAELLKIGQKTYSDYELGKYIVQEGELVLNENYEADQAQKEAERIAKLNLTGTDVERGIYQVVGMDFDDILVYITELKPEGIDIKALKIELKANHFYRGNPYVDIVGELLGFSKTQLDKFFETNDPQYLKK